MDQGRATGRKRWLVAAIKLLIVAVVVWCVSGTLTDAWRQLRGRPLQWNFGWLAAAGGFYLAGTLLCGIYWHCVLRRLGQNVSLPQTLRAYYIGHLGKYVPGKAMVVILRAGLVRGQGVDTALAAASVFFETLTMMAVGAFLSAAIVAFWLEGRPLLVWAALAMMVCAGLPTLPPVFRCLVRLVGVGRRDPAVAAKLAELGYGTMLLGWALTGLGWVVLGLSLWAVLMGCGQPAPNPAAQLHLYTAAVSLATVVGFASFVPGGAVVREAVLAELLIPFLGEGPAWLGAILLRVTWLLAELLISGILYLGMRFRQKT